MKNGPLLEELLVKTLRYPVPSFLYTNLTLILVWSVVTKDNGFVNIVSEKGTCGTETVDGPGWDPANGEGIGWIIPGGGWDPANGEEIGWIIPGGGWEPANWDGPGWEPVN